MSDTSQTIKDITTAVWKEARKGAKKHYKTGTMYSRILMKTKENAGIVWIADNNMMVNWRGKRVNYATFVLYGTKPHLICPKKRKFLRIFSMLDKFRFESKCVHHPGYKGDDFLYKAAKEVFENLDKLIN
jgi:hypothetical protein